MSILIPWIVLGSLPLCRAQISPGPLSRSHQDLDRPLQCLKCHAGGSDSLRDRCLDCHGEISWLEANGRGLHGRTRGEDCARCHAEHAGREPGLIRFEEGSPEQFDHARAGWPLAGKHASVKCIDCHKPAFQVQDEDRLSRREKRERSFLGLEPDCAACHEDVHRGALGSDCRQCHLPTTWTSVPGFDHARTGYALTGKHAVVDCRKCHRAPTQTVAGNAVADDRPVRTPLRHDECSDCHTDPHQGRAGPSCSSCHVTESFHRVDNRDFDHARTGFSLEGKHLQVSCKGCHRRDPGGSQAEPILRPSHSRCGDCHADAHGGQLASREDRGECASCHRVEGWKPSTFTVKDHATLTFVLEGRHAATECAACHGPNRKGQSLALSAEKLGSARVAFELGETKCVSCHSDPHGGHFAAGGARAKELACLACHSHDAFRPSTIDAEAHRGFGFPIEGGHRDVACDRCHKEILPRPSEAVVPAVRPEDRPLLFGADRRCEACHKDKSPHGDQFARRRDGGACGSCHGDGSFSTATRFNHDRHSRFPLLRSHGLVACARCHDGKPDDSGRMVVVYRPVSFECKGCHLQRAPTIRGRGARTPDPADRGRGSSN